MRWAEEAGVAKECKYGGEYVIFSESASADSLCNSLLFTLQYRYDGDIRDGKPATGRGQWREGPLSFSGRWVDGVEMGAIMRCVLPCPPI